MVAGYAAGNPEKSSRWQRQTGTQAGTWCRNKAESPRLTQVYSRPEARWQVAQWLQALHPGIGSEAEQVCYSRQVAGKRHENSQNPQRAVVAEMAADHLPRTERMHLQVR